MGLEAIMACRDQQVFIWSKSGSSPALYVLQCTPICRFASYAAKLVFTADPVKFFTGSAVKFYWVAVKTNLAAYEAKYISKYGCYIHYLG